MKKNSTSGLNAYYASKVDELSSKLRSKRENLLRLTAQRNELNQKVRALKEELQLLQESGSSIGEVVKQMGKKKVLVKVRVRRRFRVVSASFPQIFFFIDFFPHFLLCLCVFNFIFSIRNERSKNRTVSM